MLLHSLVVVQLLNHVWLFVTPMDCSRPCFRVLHHLPEFAQVKLFSHVWLFAALWTVACQAPLFMGFSRQEYWSGLPFPSPGDLPDPGIEAGSPTLQADSSPSEPPGKTRSLRKLLHWIGDTIQPSHSLLSLSSCPQSFLALGSFPMSWLFISVAKVLELQLYIHPSNEYSVLISYMFKFSLGIIIRIFDHLFACFLKRKKTTTSNSKKRYCKN